MKKCPCDECDCQNMIDASDDVCEDCEIGYHS
jgi:hypothetical protein